MKQYTEDELHRALLEVNAGCPIRQAACRWGIPYGTLRHRLKGRQSRNAAFTHMQHLAETQEENLASYIRTQESLGRRLTHQEIKKLAGRMMGDGNQRLGNKWMARFKRRNAPILNGQSRASSGQEKSSKQYDEAVSAVKWYTPRRSADIQRQLHLYSQLCKNESRARTIRLMSRKIQKGGNQLEAQIAIQEQQHRHLLDQLESQQQQQQSRRKKAPLSPNSTSACTRHIQQMQDSLGDATDKLDGSRESELPGRVEDCIWVGGKPKE
ncbi:hypothetical protein LZ32DRAFT_683801 [Colletotrichum eremochloae]|nr:hypothetical protein LZ32DRAFT_683801 [Colletotrichum eremochloae]